MNKQDWAIVVVLFGLLLAWMLFFPKFFSGAPQAPRAGIRAEPANAAYINGIDAESPVVVQTTAVEAKGGGPGAAVDEDPPDLADDAQIETVVISNECMQACFSSRGASLLGVVLPGYRRNKAYDSGPVELDFHESPALTYSGLSGFSAQHGFKILAHEPDKVFFERANSRGLIMRRTFFLRPSSDYQISVLDELVNTGEEETSVPEAWVSLGPLSATGKETTAGIAYLGVDAYPSVGGEKVVYWASRIAGLFADEKKTMDLERLPAHILKRQAGPVHWLAVKSKFFVQILTPPKDSVLAYSLRATRKLVPGENTGTAKAKKAEIATVSADLQFDKAFIAPGQSLKRELSFYVGPKKYSILKTLGLGQEEVMEFGWWSWFCKILLVTLNAIHRVVPNYGVAIILLTILVRVVFWPITHKSTESMKKMQALQPLMTELRAKHKDNPKKLQEETMLLYKQHKVNPVSGCLPMLIQIPVFIALFVVLRSAIELRFARFLWIQDLSEPENLLAGLLPFGVALNVLPLLMVATMFLQQKLAPTGGDPAQQRMMMVFMPIMMLVFFYNMASGLILYWTVSNVIMIVQQVMAKVRSRNQPVLATS